MPLRDHFQRLIEHDARANRQVLQSLRGAQRALERDGAAAGAPAFTRAVEVFAHILAARRIWLSRIDAATVPPPEVFPAGWSLEQCGHECGELDGAWSAFLRAMPAAALADEVRYTSTEGQPWRSRIDDILTHVATHGAYHRGQIARLVAEAGGEPAETDYILSARRPDPPATDRPGA
jgi:uncharacterized damage-inducible protein DinB